MNLILTLTGALTAALVFGFTAQRAKLSPIVGYLLAGIVVGPFTPGFVANGDLTHQFAEIGIILLMFGVGINFHISELLAVRRIALPGALVGVSVGASLGMLLAHTFGWSLQAGAVYGVAVSVSSTVVLLRVLADRGELHSRTAHITIGWLVVEDLLIVLALILVPVITDPALAASTSEIALAGLKALMKVAGLVVFTALVGKRAIPALLGYVARTRSRELFTLSVLVLALGIAVGAAGLFGVSMALGAFLAGIVVGQSNFSARAASEALPMRDAFAVLFFVSVGMLFDPKKLAPNAALIGATLAIVLVGKPLAVYAVVRLLGNPTRLALSIATALAQIGEFSFVIAALGTKIGILSDAATQAIVVVSIVSIMLSPLLVRAAPSLAEWLGEANLNEQVLESVPERRVVVVGYGPVGQTLTRLLLENALSPVVVELNHETVEGLKRQGIDAVYGDASQIEVLRAAGTEGALGLVFAASGVTAESVVTAAKELNPSIRVLARTTFVREVLRAQQAGADIVVAAESVVAVAMANHLLDALGESHADVST